MKPKSTHHHLLALAATSALLGTAAHAAPGTWNANADGDWNTAGNWELGIVAAGAGSLATLGDFIDADRTINLDIAPIIGGITAADTTHNYTISGANTLTLDSTGSSAVNVTTAGRTLTIASVLNGNDGITKSGAGTLALSNANSISGIFALTSGTLQLGHANAMGTSTLTMTSGTTLQLRNDANTVFTAPINTAPTTGVTYNIDVNRTASGTGRTLSLGNLTFATPTSGQVTNTINVTGGNDYILGLGTISAPSSGGGPHPFIVNATTAGVTISKFSAGAWGNALTLQGGNAITLNTLEFVSNGNNSLTVSGSGTVVTLGTTVASGRNNASPAYTLNSGTLNLTTTTSLANVFTSGTASAPTFAINGGTLNNTRGSALTLAANSGLTAGSPNITIGGDFAFGTALSTSANNLHLGNGSITNAGNRTITFNGTGTTLTMGGTMTNGVAGNQTTTVNGTGNTLSLGGYALGANRTNVINGTGNVTITGAITQTNGTTSGLTYSGSGTLSLTGANTYTGLTTVSSGTVAVTGLGKLYSNANREIANAVTVNTGGTLEFDNWNWDGSFGQLWFNRANMVINGGTLRYVGTTANASTNRSFTIGASGATLESATSGQKWTVTSSGGYTTLASNGGTLTLTGTGDGQIDQIIPGSGGLTKAGSGTWTLAGTNSYTGKTIVQNGTLSFSAGNASATANQPLGANATLDLGVASTSSGRLLYTGGAGTLAKNINVLGNGTDTIENGGTGLLTLTGTLTKNGTTLTLKGGSNGITVSGTGTIAGSSANSDLIVDGGTVNLNTANTYNGPTFLINGATLNANATNALPTANGRSAIRMDETGTGSSTLAMTVGQSIASLGGASSSAVNLNANTLTIGTTSGTTTFAGAINGSGGSLIKDGLSTQILTGANMYTGTTTVSQGVLNIRNDTALGTTAGGTSVGSGAALEIQNGITVGAEALTLNGPGVSNGGALRNVSGSNTFGGPITLAGDSRINSDAGLLTLNVASGDAITGTFNLTFGGAGNITVADAIGIGAGSVIKDGAGTLTLSAANTYTGPTTVSEGTLVVDGSIANSSLVTVSPGATISGSGTIGALTVSTDGFISPGNSPGILNTGNYTQAGLYLAEINGLTPGTEHDQINVTGTVDITGGSLSALFSGAYAENDLIFILLNDGIDPITGTFTGLPQGASVTSYGGFDWQISYIADNTGIGAFTGGNDIALMAVSLNSAVIPEPSAFFLGSFGLLAAACRRRR